MTLDPPLGAPIVVQVHAVAAIAAFAPGAVNSPRRRARDRIAGAAGSGWG